MRVSMGLSFHDEKSMSETIESLHFQVGRQIGPDHPTSESEMGDIRQETRIDDIGIRLSNDIQKVKS